MELYQILEATTSQNAEARKNAVSLLENAAVSNYSTLVDGLVSIFVKEDADVIVRSTAGLYFKNMLTSRINSTRSQLISRWQSLDVGYRNSIKNKILFILGKESSKPSIAAQLICVLANAELLIDGWPDLLNILHDNIIGSSANVVEASIEAVGYMCQDLPQSLLAPFSSDILNNIVYCMAKERSERVRLVATKAMLNSIEFVSKNFAIEAQRNLIMQNICQAAVDEIPAIKVVGLQCLSRIISLYYDYMEAYMTQALFSITYEAMKSENDEVSLQGIEFWSTLCEVEEEIDESFEGNEIPQSISKKYCQKAIQYIAPYILERLCKDDEEDDDDDSWNPHKAASVCLMLMTRNCVTEISSLILGFIGSNFNNSESVRRDAALVALGSLIEASTDDQVDVIIQNGYPIILQLCKDSSPRVRDTAFWALGKIYHRDHKFASGVEKTLQSMKTIFDSLNDNPRVAVNALWAMTYIVKAMHDPLRRSLGRQPDTLLISNNYENILNAAYMSIKRQDACERSLRIAAFELLNTLIECHPADVHVLIGRNMDFAIQQCNQLFYATNSDLSQSQINELSQLQSLYCMLLQNFIHALDPREINLVSEPLLVTLMNYCSVCKKSTVQEDILLTIGVLVQKSPFDKVLPQLQTLIPIISVLFQNIEDVSLCVSCSSVIGDICTSAGNAFTPFAQGIIAIVFKYLSHIETDVQLQIHLLVLLGDLAIALGLNFKPFVPECLDLLKQVSSVSSCADDDFYVLEYYDELKSTTLETYTSIIQGVYRRLDKNEEDYLLWMKNIPYIMTLIESISSDPTHSDEVTRSCCGLLGDLFHLFHRELLSNIKNDSIQKLVIEAINSSVPKTQTVGFWLKSLLESN